MERTVVIVDDHLLIAKAIRSIIEKFPGYRVLYECENGQVLTERLSQGTEVPDIILLDISMPVMDGYAAAAWIEKHFPQIQIMVLTMQQDDDSLLKMIRSGAAGYIHKNVHPADLENALFQLTEKGYYYPDWASSRLLRNLAKGQLESSPVTILNDRESEFLKYACTELTYKEIGAKMYCSPRTVEGYRDALFTKLGVKTRVALALYAVKTGLFKIV
ncbi:MAG TPA: response regulator transcription factor [Saprospiraceae bacterium]|nr:response regulator transcription factor [Saprospiraceae bacterium]